MGVSHTADLPLNSSAQGEAGEGPLAGICSSPEKSWRGLSQGGGQGEEARGPFGESFVITDSASLQNQPDFGPHQQ